MAQRISESRIESQLTWLRTLGFNVYLEGSYGAFRLVEMNSDSSTRDLSGHMTNKEIWAFINGMITTMQALNKKRNGVVQAVMLNIPVEVATTREAIASETTTHIVGCFTRGKIAVECHNVDTARYWMDQAPFIANDGYAIYTRAEWEKGCPD